MLVLRCTSSRRTEAWEGVTEEATTNRRTMGRRWAGIVSTTNNNTSSRTSNSNNTRISNSTSNSTSPSTSSMLHPTVTILTVCIEWSSVPVGVGGVERDRVTDW